MLVTCALLAAALTTIGASISAPVADAAPGGQASRYVAISPIRVLDTRDPGNGFVRADDSLSLNPLTVDVVAAAAVDPLDVEAVAINLTITQPVAPGWLKSWPTANSTPDAVATSAVNNRDANETIANFAIVPVGANGRISIQSLSGSHVVVDVQGVFARATSSRAGRFVPLAVPARAIDTRDTPNRVLGGTNLDLDLTATVGIPRNASAALINLVAATTQRDGYLTAYPAGSPPLASNVNYLGGGSNVAGSAITRLDNGRLKIFASGTTDVIVDVIGYMTGDTDVESASGLFVPLAPERHYDSRPNEAPFGTAPLTPLSSRTVQIAGRFSVPATGVLGVASNLTMTGTDGAGYLVIYPKEPVPPRYSTVNSMFANHSIANHAIVALSNGTLSVFSLGRSDFIIDISGYFLDGTTPPPTTPRRALTEPAPTPDVNPGVVPVPPPDSDYDYLQEARGSNFSLGAYALAGRRYYGWDPCDPITYAVNAQRATQEQVAALNAAIRDVEDASGFDLVYVGQATGSLNTDSVDPRVVGGGEAMAVFGFSDPYETPILAGGTIGIGGLGDGIDGRTAVTKQPGDQFAWIVRDGFAIADISDVPGAPQLRATFAHEIGHMVGLDHVNAPGELMRPVLTGQNTFGNGDKNGLFNIGEPQCPGGAALTLEAPADAPIDIDVTGWIAD